MPRRVTRGTLEPMPEDFNPPPRGSFDSPTSAYPGTPPPPHTAPPVGYASPVYSYPPPPRRSGWFWVAILGGIFALVVLIVCVTFASLAKSFGSDNDAGTDSSGSTIAVVDISGVILDADKIDRQLDKFGDNSNVKAIILHIDSPGGGAAASQEIYHEVLRIRNEKHKKVVASVESVGASGAYYIASACDKIYANPASVVGSIGVIMEWTNYGELLRWAKLKNITIHAGELKDAGDPTRDLTPKEEAYFQSLVDNMYGQFVHDVATGRHTTDDAIKPLATGQVWTGEQAIGLHLIDAQGGFRIALMDTAKDVGISGEPRIVRPSKERHGIWAELNDDTNTLFPNPSKLLDHAPGFYFMWK
jgi:protease-4